MRSENRSNPSPKEERPFFTMLLQYQNALDAVTQRIAELRRQAQDLALAVPPVPQTVQYQLDKRIQTLCEERAELTEDIRSIRVYAEREISWEDEISRE